MADPANVLAVDDVQMMTGLNCRVAVAAEVDIENLIGRLNSLETAVSEAVEEDEEEDGLSAAEVTELRESADDAPVIKLVYSILGQAVNEGASDVHFEPEERDMRVRFRVDGVLSEVARVPKRMVAGVVSRIKIMSELDIAEKRVPQDGRVAVNVEERKVDLRVVTVPDRARRGGDDPHPRQVARRCARSTSSAWTATRGRASSDSFHQAYGAVLVTGPTGSGKSTTLYSALTELNDVAKNILTIEDPVEYRLAGRQPDGRQPQGRARLRDRPALDAPRRPRRDHGRRDPRRGDGADRDRGRADRPHGADHAAHQRRARARSPGSRRWGSSRS